MSQIFVEAHVHRQRVQYLYVGLVFDVCTFAFLAAFLLFSWCCVVCLGITFNKSVTCVGFVWCLGPVAFMFMGTLIINSFFAQAL